MKYGRDCVYNDSGNSGVCLPCKKARKKKCNAYEHKVNNVHEATSGRRVAVATGVSRGSIAPNVDF